MQNCRQSSSSRTTISRVDAKQQRRHCLLELAEARQLCFVCLGLYGDALLFFTAAESFERRAAQLDQYFSAVWGMHHGNGAPAGVYKSSAVACLNSFWSIERILRAFWLYFTWHILFGIGVQHATSFNYTMKLAACWFLSNVHRTYIVSFYFMVSWDWGFTFSFPFFPFFPSAFSVASKITEVLWIMKV